jgi:lysophospholipase L1-like esterase
MRALASSRLLLLCFFLCPADALGSADKDEQEQQCCEPTVRKEDRPNGQPLADSSMQAAQSDLHQLLDLTVSPDTRRQREQRLCSQQLPLSAKDLEPVLGFGSPQIAQISGARIASCRDDLNLAPLMLESFLGAKFGYLPFDPDIFERLLFALQNFPKDGLTARLEEADYEHLLEAAWAHLLDTRLETLLSNPELQRPNFSQGQRQTARDFLIGWLRDLIEGPGLVTLRADSGDRARFLLEQFEAVLLAELIAGGQPEVVRAAIEAARHLAHPFPEPSRALQQRLTAGTLEPEFGSLLSLLPDANSAVIEAPGLRKVYPETSVQLASSQRSWPVQHVQPSKRKSPWKTVALACVLLMASWLLAMVGWPRKRHVLKRLGAVLLAPLFLIACEGALALAEVSPRMDLRPSFNPNKVPGQLWQVQQLDGTDFAVTLEGRARQLSFPVLKDDGEWRIFVLGESSAHGSYYPLESTFAALLENNLSTRNPGQKVRVINAGVGAALSDGIAHYGFEALKYQADLLVLYLGNNDMSHFVAMAGFRGFSARSIRLRYLLDRLRIVRVLSDMLPQGLLDRFSGPQTDSGYFDLEEMSAQDRNRLLELAEANATQNIERVARRATSQGAQVLLAIQAQNQDICPSDQPNDSSSGCFPETLRRIAIEAGRRTGATVVDVPAALRHHAGSQRTGIAGAEYFYDTVHPSLLGHAVIARSLTPQAEDLLREKPTQ